MTKKILIDKYKPGDLTVLGPILWGSDIEDARKICIEQSLQSPYVYCAYEQVTYGLSQLFRYQNGQKLARGQYSLEDKPDEKS